ncbi:MAG TPA: hypothetical protein VJN92_17870 [Candidatus Acidoferrum sp.]|nr:hypothetical protein [Candidatus Acidoferrum sp.]
MRQFFAGLLLHYVGGVPVRPILVAMAAGAGFVLAMCLRRAPRASQIVYASA